MKILNNKGMSIIEILLCFILVTVISASIYSTVNAFSNKKIEEQAKFRIYTYKNVLTKEIEDDIVKRGLIGVELEGDHEPIIKTHCITQPLYDANDDSCVESGDINASNIFISKFATRYFVKFTFRDGQQKVLHIVTQNDAVDVTNTYIVSDKYYVAYGDINDKIVYPIPDLGYSEDNDGRKNYDLTISVVNTKVKDGVFFLEMRFEHTLLDQRYGLRITAPINMDAYDRNYE